MPATIGHSLTATTPDNTAYEIRPSHWNETHVYSLNLAGTEISNAFNNGGGVSFGLSNGSITAAAPAGAPSPVNFSAGTTSGNLGSVVFADSNGVSFGLNGSTVTATVKTDYLTTAALSNHSHGNPTLALTNMSGTTASASNGFTLSLSANAGGAGDGVNILAAGTQTANTTGTVLFNNANGISFGMNNSSVITASHNALTTARASNDAVGLNTALTAGPLAWTVNSSGISLNAGGAAGTSTGFTGGNSISGSMTHNTAGLAISLAHPAWLTTAAASDHSHGNPTLALTNLSGTTASASNGFTLSLSAGVGGAGDGVNILAAGTQTANTTGTVLFQNSNNITFGMSDSSVVTASFNPINIGMSNVGNTAGTSGTIDGAGAQYVFAGGNNITVSQSVNGSSATLSIVGGAGVADGTISRLPASGSYNTQSVISGTTGGTGGSTQLSVNLRIGPMQAPAYVTYTNAAIGISCQTVAGTGSASGGYFAGLYVLSQGTRLTLLTDRTSNFAFVMSQNSVTARTMSWWYGTNSTSNSSSASGNISASFTGGREVILDMIGGSLTPGDYYLAIGHTCRTSGANLNLSNSMIGNVLSATAILRFGAAAAAAYYPFNNGFVGHFSTTTNVSNTGFPVFPNTIHTSAISILNNANIWPVVYLNGEITA